jgi:hypothetical protein
MLPATLSPRLDAQLNQGRSLRGTENTTTAPMTAKIANM